MRWMAPGLAIPAGSAQAVEPVESWGKPGVGFDAYRADAVGCATRGYLRDVSQDEPAKAFVRGFRSADDWMNAPPLGLDQDDPEPFTERITRIRRGSIRQTQPDRRLREVQAIQGG